MTAVKQSKEGASLGGGDTAAANLGLARLIEQVGKAAYNLGYTDGLNPAQWAALRYFSESTSGRKTVTGFASFQGTTKGTASQTISALVRKGLLERKADTVDRRVHKLILTAEGKELLDQDPLEQLAQSLDVLDQKDRWDLANMMEQILRALMTRRKDRDF